MTPRLSRSERYVIVSPVKDEGPYIEKTLRSVVGQTLRPACWLLVDDGSSDGTAECIERYCRDHPWIGLVRTDRRGARMTGSAEIVAFNSGLRRIPDTGYDFVVKLDGDLALERDYFEKLLARFAGDERLGIASGIYLENGGKGWRAVSMPGYHAAGASKMVRRACFEEIGGFIESPGWDTVDEIRAQSLGWKTAHFPDIRFRHLRAEGSGMGCRKTQVMYGEIYYLTGGSRILFFGKMVHRALFGKPRILASLLIGYGYAQSLLRKKSLLVSPEEARVYRTLQWARLLARSH